MVLEDEELGTAMVLEDEELGTAMEVEGVDDAGAGGVAQARARTTPRQKSPGIACASIALCDEVRSLRSLFPNKVKETRAHIAMESDSKRAEYEEWMEKTVKKQKEMDQLLQGQIDEFVRSYIMDLKQAFGEMDSPIWQPVVQAQGDTIETAPRPGRQEFRVTQTNEKSRRKSDVCAYRKLYGNYWRHMFVLLARGVCSMNDFDTRGFQGAMEARVQEGINRLLRFVSEKNVQAWQERDKGYSEQSMMATYFKGRENEQYIMNEWGLAQYVMHAYLLLSKGFYGLPESNDTMKWTIHQWKARFVDDPIENHLFWELGHINGCVNSSDRKRRWYKEEESSFGRYAPRRPDAPPVLPHTP